LRAGQSRSGSLNSTAPALNTQRHVAPATARHLIGRGSDKITCACVPAHYTEHALYRLPNFTVPTKIRAAIELKFAQQLLRTNQCRGPRTAHQCSFLPTAVACGAEQSQHLLAMHKYSACGSRLDKGASVPLHARGAGRAPAVGVGGRGVAVIQLDGCDGVRWVRHQSQHLQDPAQRSPLTNSKTKAHVLLVHMVLR
jgi:hypothetical protein